MVQLYYLVPVCVISMFKFIFINLSTLVTTTTTTILSFTPSLLQEKKNSARRYSWKTWRLGMRLNRVLVLRREQRTNNSYRMLRFESFVFTCLTYRNVQRFRNSQSMNFMAWKLIKWAKFVLVLTNTHILKNQESSGTEFQRYSGPQLSRKKN